VSICEAGPGRAADREAHRRVGPRQAHPGFRQHRAPRCAPERVCEVAAFGKGEEIDVAFARHSELTRRLNDADERLTRADGRQLELVGKPTGGAGFRHSSGRRGVSWPELLREAFLQNRVQQVTWQQGDRERRR